MIKERSVQWFSALQRSILELHGWKGTFCEGEYDRNLDKIQILMMDSFWIELDVGGAHLKRKRIMNLYEGFLFVVESRVSHLSSL